jgi:hypothetical protein
LFQMPYELSRVAVERELWVSDMRDED